MSNCVITRVEPGDAAAIGRLQIQVHELHVQQVVWLFRSVSAEELGTMLIDVLDHPDTRGVVARRDGELVGYALGTVQIRPARATVQEYRALYLDQIAVHPEAQRIGIGRQLMAEFAAIARHEDLTHVDLDTWEFNQSARRFFQSLGYQLQQRRLSRRVDDN